RNRVVPARMPGMTAQNPLRRERAALARAMDADGLARIGAAGGKETAIRADHRTQGKLIHPDRAREHVRRRAHASASSRAFARFRRKVENGTEPVSRRAISTSSTPGISRPAKPRRAASRNRRLARLRVTALPIFLVAVKPTRSSGSALSRSACMTNPLLAIFLPRAARRRKSARFLKRFGGVSRAMLGSWRGGRESGGKLGAAL